MNVAPALLRIYGLQIGYRMGSATLTAVDDVSLTVNRGEAVGLVGESGCGKSTLAHGLLRILPDNGLVLAGRVFLDGVEITSLSDEAFRTTVRWKQISMVFQSAMNALSPVEQVGTQLRRVHRLHRSTARPAESEATIDDLMRKVALSPTTKARYPHELSGGMRQRVAIVMSLLATPQLVIADEATTALDVVIQAQILSELAAFQRSRGLGMLVVSHDFDVIAQICDRVAVMYAGRLVEVGHPARVLAAPRHPYTAALVASLPRLTGPRVRLAALAGSPPELSAQLSGCRFAPRCPLAQQICWDTEPELSGREHESAARCHFAGDSRIATLWRATA